MADASPQQDSFGSAGSDPSKGKAKGKGWYGDKGFKGKGEGKGPPGKYGPPGAGEYGPPGAKGGPPGSYGKGEYGGKSDPYGKGYGKADGNPYGKGVPPPPQQSYQQSPYQQSPQQQQQQQEQQQQQKAVEAPLKLVGAAWPPAAIFIIEALKVGDWFTEIFKILANAPAAKPYWGWVIMTFVLACVILVMRAVDQISLLVRSAKWDFSKKCCLTCLTLPISIPLLPLNWATWSMYDQRNLPIEHLKVFRQRPLGTVFMGIPGYSVMSQILLDRSLVMHPAQAHFRSAQSIWQTFLEDVPCFIVDMIVIMNAPEGEDTFWFMVSFGYSCFLTLVLIAYAVREVDFTERNLEIMAENKKDLPALTN